MLKILVADDHAVMRHGVKTILADHFQGAIIGEAVDAHDLLQQVRQGTWHLVILDIGMPGKSALEAIKDMKRHGHHVPVLVYSAYPEDQLALRMLKAGAAGYLSKDSASEELVLAVRKVLAGGKFISPSLAETLAENFEETFSKAPHETLSDREYQVMCLLAAGKSVKEIGDDLSVSISTINTYRKRIFKKMHVKRDAELTMYAVQHRLISQPATAPGTRNVPLLDP